MANNRWKLCVLTGLMVVGFASVSAEDVCHYSNSWSATCGAGAVSELTVNGRAELNKTTVKGDAYVNGESSITAATVMGNLQVNGSTQLSQTTVMGESKINGRFTATDSSLNTLKVNGAVSLRQTQVKGVSHINGSLTAVGSHLSKEMTIKSQSITLDSTTAQDIIVKQESDDSPQKVILKNHTKINGFISFEQGNGIVYLSKDSSMTGKIRGGKIVTQ